MVHALHYFDYYNLTQKLEHFTKVAKKALSCWDLPENSNLKLLNFTENATFLVTSENHDPVIMRVHRLDYAKKNSIKTELQWIMDLKKDTDVSLATPIPTKDGEYVATIQMPELEEHRHVVCFSFVQGKAPVDSSDGNGDIGELISKIEKIPDAITIPVFKAAAVVSDFAGRMKKKSALTEDDRQMYRILGSIIGKIHKQSKNWQAPEYYERMEWDFDGTFGKDWNNFYGADYRSEDVLSKHDIEILDQCVELIHARLESYGTSPDRYGMIHSDLRTANLLQDGKNITVLDFDDCGKGWYMYDIAGAVALMEHRGDLQDVVNEILNGYKTIMPVSEEDRQEIGTFIMMRRLGMLQSLICRIGNVQGGSGESCELTPEVLAFYAKGSVVLAKRYLKEYQFGSDYLKAPEHVAI
jgi:Ser/Thr protein kinase RdoA (MazF antagonist)